jgi:hypothetical protein
MTIKKAGMTMGDFVYKTDGSYDFEIVVEFCLTLNFL